MSRQERLKRRHSNNQTRGEGGGKGIGYGLKEKAPLDKFVTLLPPSFGSHLTFPKSFFSFVVIITTMMSDRQKR